MQVSPVAIANMALQRIGARGTIASLTENSPNAIKVNTVWSLILAEVLSERDWKFAKTKVNLQQSALTPVFEYQYAYALPADFLRLVRPKEIPEERRIADADTYWFGGGLGNYGRLRQSDVPVWPRCVAPYIVETVANPAVPANTTYTLYLLTNYGAAPNVTNFAPVGITYIRLISDLTVCLPGFVNALAYRLAAELAPAITENDKKGQAMMSMYLETLNGAQAQLECDDSVKDEAGSYDWVHAGRYWNGRW